MTVGEDARITVAADTGGTFTDLVVDWGDGRPTLYKRPTTPDNPVEGLFAALNAAASDVSVSVPELLGRCELFVFGTTRATNAIVTGNTARTALLVTEGHPDILLFREGGGRRSLFDYSQEYPDPYIPRKLTFEIRERVLSDGTILIPLDEGSVIEASARMRAADVEAVAVCLLWSMINGKHEERIGELLDEHLAGIPYTLSKRLNPTVREYRRVSSTAIDASLKPLMSKFIRYMEKELRAKGFRGRLLIMTSSGGVLDADDVAEAPIHSIGSGPAGAPVAGRYFVTTETAHKVAIVTDAGGTTFDVSVLRDGAIPRTQETTVGEPVGAYITGFPSVDVRSVGAGGGSIAWVDKGGLLHVGPMSAGAEPGPACYGLGGDQATITDACLVLGYIDPDYFLGGDVRIDVDRAIDAVRRSVAEPLSLDVHEAASAILTLGIERMVTAIENITLNQGIDPQASMMIGGGGGAGLYGVGIARRLGCWPVLIPGASAALSATGALFSDLQRDFSETSPMSTGNFDFEKANGILEGLEKQCKAFVRSAGADAGNSTVKLFVEARYPHQVWEITVPLPGATFANSSDVSTLVVAFHAMHETLFAIKDEASDVEILTWRAQVSCSLEKRSTVVPPVAAGAAGRSKRREAYFSSLGQRMVDVYQHTELSLGKRYTGPLFVESPVTTIVVDRGAQIERTEAGSLLLYPANESAERTE